MYKLGRRQCRGQFFSELGVIVPRGTPDVRLVSVWSVKPLNPRIRPDKWPQLLLLAPPIGHRMFKMPPNGLWTFNWNLIEFEYGKTTE